MGIELFWIVAIITMLENNNIPVDKFEVFKSSSDAIAYINEDRACPNKHEVRLTLQRRYELYKMAAKRVVEP